TASRYLRNQATGDVAFLEGGLTHHFDSCAKVAAWGSACGAEMKLTSNDYAALRSGEAMTWFATTSAGGGTKLIEDGKLRLVYDAATARKIHGGADPYAPQMPDVVASAY